MRWGELLDLVEHAAGRWRCRTFGHQWSPWYGIVRYCERITCHGHADAQEFR